MHDSDATQILVTGGSGFVAAHCIAAALNAGHTVRTTLRSPERAPEVRDMVTAAGADPAALTFAAADLTDDAGWAEAVAGCDAVLHVASPFPAGTVEHEDELIVPARDGTLRVLRAARDAGVRRVVMTSSFAAIGYGHPPTARPFTERDWTDIDGEIAPYIKSKAVAEREAWTFIAREGGELELAVVNPVGIFGPALGPDLSASIALVASLLGGAMSAGAPNLAFGVVDVRDVADLHLRAMTDPAAAGERFLATAGDSVTLPWVAAVLRERLGEAAAAVPAGALADEVVRDAARHDPAMAQIAAELGAVRHVSGEHARRVLGWEPRGADEAVVATAESLLRLGIVR